MKALSDWFGMRRAKGFAVNESRWVVLDVEASGLDPKRAHLLAIAAIALRVDWNYKRLEIDLGDSFEVFLRQQMPSSRANIMLHGIGAQQQRDGVPAQRAMREFCAFIGNSPLLAFHSAFDRALIRRASLVELGAELPNPWIDIEQLCAVTHASSRARSLDEWMEQLAVTCAVRHQASADALAECDILQRLWGPVAAQCRNWQDVARMAASHRWIARG